VSGLVFVRVFQRLEAVSVLKRSADEEGEFDVLNGVYECQEAYKYDLDYQVLVGLRESGGAAYQREEDLDPYRYRL
jgi:hypothetical protein